jgi:acetyl esterase/lipase
MDELEQPEPERLQVWPHQVPDADLWRDLGPELERPRWENSRLVRNVSQPTLAVFHPEPGTAKGVGIILCPGGAYHFLMVDKEGTDVARWLNRRGITAFVLKYRVFPTPDDDEVLVRIASNPHAYREQMEQVRPMAVADALQALRTIRGLAHSLNIGADRLGIMGFSAGGFVAAAAASRYDSVESRPDFAAAIYAGWSSRQVPADVPPLFIAAASDDAVVDTQASTSLYTAWRSVNRPVELHLYANGGHGFAVKRQGSPSDSWIDLFWVWLQAQGFVPE